MGIIRTSRLIFDYIRRDEEENVEEVNRAIDDLNVDIEKGSFVAILGHNGSGKSTFAKHINGILAPTEGTVWVADMNTADEESIWEIRKKAGMVFQNPDNQIIGNVVEEDVGFGPENIGVPTKEIWERVEDALEKVGMLIARKESPNNLSGGQKQRVAIAGILAMHPKCIVLDEATAMLDPIGRRDVLQAVRELNKKEKITVIWVTHYMDEVVEADSVIVMNKGEIALEGTPKQIFPQVELLQQYRLDVPQATLLAHELRKRGLPIPEDIITVEELVDAVAYALGK